MPEHADPSGGVGPPGALLAHGSPPSLVKRSAKDPLSPPESHGGVCGRSRQGVQLVVLGPADRPGRWERQVCTESFTSTRGGRNIGTESHDSDWPTSQPVVPTQVSMGRPWSEVDAEGAATSTPSHPYRSRTNHHERSRSEPPHRISAGQPVSDVHSARTTGIPGGAVGSMGAGAGSGQPVQPVVARRLAASSVKVAASCPAWDGSNPSGITPSLTRAAVASR